LRWASLWASFQRKCAEVRRGRTLPSNEILYAGREALPLGSPHGSVYTAVAYYAKMETLANEQSGTKMEMPL
jgi:hypothetical protein